MFDNSKGHWEPREFVSIALCPDVIHDMQELDQ